MGRFVEDEYIADFVVEQPREDVWASFERLKKSDESWWMPGWESPGTALEVEAPRLLRVNKDAEPCKDSTIAVTLESVEKGTKVLVVQSGFPAWAKGNLEAFTIGGNQIIADLVLYLETGVQAGRHSMPWAFAGLFAREVPTGLEVTMALPGCFAERVVLQTGDRLLTLGGAPVFAEIEVQALCRVFTMGQELEATWVRGRELQRGTASL